MTETPMIPTKRVELVHSLPLDQRPAAVYLAGLNTAANLLHVPYRRRVLG